MGAGDSKPPLPQMRRHSTAMTAGGRLRPASRATLDLPPALSSTDGRCIAPRQPLRPGGAWPCGDSQTSGPSRRGSLAHAHVTAALLHQGKVSFDAQRRHNSHCDPRPRPHRIATLATACAAQTYRRPCTRLAGKEANCFFQISRAIFRRLTSLRPCASASCSAVRGPLPEKTPGLD